MPAPFSLHTFYADGAPDGLRIVQKTGWNGQGVLCSRARFPEHREAEELDRPGVYLLVGNDENGRERLYIGEGDVADRLTSHATQKAWWKRLLAFTSKDDNLNKAHVQYIEAKLVGLANEVNRVVLDNANLPEIPPLSKADRAEAEHFLETMLGILPTLEIHFFEKGAELSMSQTRLFLEGPYGSGGEGVETEAGFLVFRGARAVKTHVTSCPAHIKARREELKVAGVLIERDDYLEFSQDTEFSSPSAAAQALTGSSVSGRALWKDADGRDMNEIEALALAPTPSTGVLP